MHKASKRSIENHESAVTLTRHASIEGLKGLGSYRDGLSGTMLAWQSDIGVSYVAAPLVQSHRRTVAGLVSKVDAT